MQQSLIASTRAVLAAQKERLGGHLRGYTLTATRSAPQPSALSQTADRFPALHQHDGGEIRRSDEINKRKGMVNIVTYEDPA